MKKFEIECKKCARKNPTGVNKWTVKSLDNDAKCRRCGSPLTRVENGD